MRWWILHAIYAVTDASANACARSKPNTGSGADPDTGTRTLSYSIPITIGAPEFLEWSIAGANVWQPSCVSGDASLNGLVCEQHHRNARSDLRGCAVFVFDGIRNVRSEWWRVLLEELTFFGARNGLLTARRPVK